MTPGKLLTVLFSCIFARTGLTTVMRSILDPQYHFYSDLASALLWYLLLMWVCVKAFELRANEQQIVGNGPNHLQINLALLCGIMFVLFNIGEHGLEVYMASQIDHELAARIWGVYDAKYKGLAPTFSLGIVLFYFVGTVAAPLGEEFFFRGLLLPTMMKRYSFGVAALLNSLVFTALHYQHQYYLSTFLFSFVLCRIYVLYKSLWMCILIHATYNLVVFTLENCLGIGRIYSTDQIGLLSNWTAELLALGASSIFLAFVFVGPKVSKVISTSRTEQVGVPS